MMDVYKRYASHEDHPLLGAEPAGTSGAAGGAAGTVAAGTAALADAAPGQAASVDGATAGGICLDFLLGAAASATPSSAAASATPSSAAASVAPSSAAASATPSSAAEWLAIVPHAAYFCGHDAFLGRVVTIVYENRATGKTCTTTLSCHGVATYTNLIVDARLRFWPSCENLLPQYQKSTVRRALAVSALKSYNHLAADRHSVRTPWDETTAGALANLMELIDGTPRALGRHLLQMGLLQPQWVSLVVLDVVYEGGAAPRVEEENNRLVFLLGAQLDQLFDPLLEYSPQVMEVVYKVPEGGSGGDGEADGARADGGDGEARRTELDAAGPGDAGVPTGGGTASTTAAICDELLTLQSNLTILLVSLLQDLIIPLRLDTLAQHRPLAAVSKVFPPTIDEVTRINCILLDLLVRASPFGASEMLRALATILPYFYRPFIRHEANLKLFPARLARFATTAALDNPAINRGGYTARQIDAIVSGSLVELPRLKLVARRLHALLSPRLQRTSAAHLAAVERVVDAFGVVEPTPQQHRAARQRVFTPTGKILTEIAAHWPMELQQGWMARKVVGIYEVRPLAPLAPLAAAPAYALVIFSDHLVFLTAPQPATLVLADILTHALVNEKPLPPLLPPLGVHSWCRIDDAVVSTFRNADGAECLRFAATLPAGFSNGAYSASYVVPRDLAHTVTELINKARILHKLTPFHLFKTDTGAVTMYLTAHDEAAYRLEQCRSPFALWLNVGRQRLVEALELRLLFMAMGASFINHHQVHLECVTRTATLLDEIVEATDLQRCVVECVSRGTRLYTSFANEALKPNLMAAFEHDLEVFLGALGDDDAKSVATRRSINASVMSIPQAYVDKYRAATAAPAALAAAPAAAAPAAKRAALLIGTPAPKRRKRGFLRKVFGFLKPRGKDAGVKDSKELTAGEGATTSATTSPTAHPADRATPPAASQSRAHPGSAQTKRDLERRLPSHVSTVDIAHSGVVEVSHLYQPQPAIHAASGTPEVDAIREPAPAPTVTTAPTPTVMAPPAATRAPSISESNILALDSLRSHSYRQRLNRLASAAEADLYADGESNWVRLDDAMLHQEIRALMQDVNMDTEDVIEIDSFYSDASVAQPEAAPAAAVPAPALAALPRDASVALLTSAQVVAAFRREIDAKFARLGTVGEPTAPSDESDASSEATVTEATVPQKLCAERAHKRTPGHPGQGDASPRAELADPATPEVSSDSYLASLLDGSLRFDFDIEVPPAPTPAPPAPIFSSPSLSYLASYIHSGRTRRDLARLTH